MTTRTKHVHFIAIGGSVMHNLALALHQQGMAVTGSDDEFFEPSKSRLAAAGLLPAENGWHPERITPELDAVIVGMHAEATNPELVRAKELGLKIYSFPEYVYEQTKDKQRIVVGGSHGKTTTTSMIMHVMRECGRDFDYMVGAQLEGFDTMVRLTREAPIAVFEGDEYLTSPIDPTPKFHHYKPDIALLTGIAWDHINVFPTFENYVSQFQKFAQTIEPGGTLIFYSGDENLRCIAASLPPTIDKMPYDALASRPADDDTGTIVTYCGKKYHVGVFGRHNMQNMHGALLACQQVGIEPEQFLTAIRTFRGAAKRLQCLCKNADSVAFLDFAHSPSKLKATVDAVRERYAGKRIVACMELHTFSSLTKAFLPHYAGCMNAADAAYVFFNPNVVEHKHLESFGTADVEAAFEHKNLKAFSDSSALVAELEKNDFRNTVLLLMTSGNFSGLDLSALANKLIH